LHLIGDIVHTTEFQKPLCHLSSVYIDEESFFINYTLDKWQSGFLNSVEGTTLHIRCKNRPRPWLWSYKRRP